MHHQIHKYGNENENENPMQLELELHRFAEDVFDELD